MRHLSRLVLQCAYAFEPRGMSLAVGRSLLATAELTVVLFTSDGTLFSYRSETAGGLRCGGVRNLSLWCMAGGTEDRLLIADVVAIVVLGITAAGYRPRWTCVPHWYVTFSLGVVMTLPNGGEMVARVGTMLLIPLCLGDERVWQWRRPVRPMAPRWRGSAFAAMVTIRFQVLVIYASAVVSKLLVSDDWRRGTAMFTVVHHPYFGAPRQLLSAVGPVVDSFAVVATLTWGVLVVELAIAVSILGGRRLRRVAFGLAVALHAATVVFMGLFSFGVIMVALLAIACAGGTDRMVRIAGRESSPPTGDPYPSAEPGADLVVRVGPNTG